MNFEKSSPSKFFFRLKDIVLSPTSLFESESWSPVIVVLIFVALFAPPIPETSSSLILISLLNLVLFAFVEKNLEQ